MQKRGLFAIGIAMACAAGFKGYSLFSKPHEGTATILPDANLAAVALFAAYQANEPASDKKYLGKVIGVSGRVQEIDLNENAGNIILGAKGGGVSCGFGPGSLSGLKNIHPGDSVSCKGRCTGFLMDVNLTDCVTEQ